MSALAAPDEFRVGRAITKQEWAELRRQSALGLPPEIANRPLKEVLLGYQRESLRERLLNNVTVIEKSRRIGLTWSFGADAALTAAASKTAGGMDVWYVGYNLEMAREFIDVVGSWARLYADAAIESEEFVFEDQDPVTGDTRQIKAFRIRFASGFEVVALPSSPRSLRGKQGLVIIDEAAFHDELDELLKAAIALTIWGGKVVVISTHNGAANPFATLVNDARSGTKPYGLLRIDFDDALRDGLYRRICQRTGEEWSPEREASWRAGVIADYGDAADEELFCVPTEGSGAWLLPSIIDARASRDVPVLRWEMTSAFTGQPETERRAAAAAWIDAVLEPALHRLDPDLPSFLGQDFARVSDLTVIWPVQIGRTLHRRTPFVVELRNVPFDQQEQVLWHVFDRLPRFVAAALDAGGNGASIAERAAQRYGMERVAQIKFTVDWYRTNMPLLKAALEADGFELPADVEVAGDFRAVKMIDGVARVPRASTARGEAAAGGKARRRHGDAAIAAALAHFASQMPIEEYDYRPASSLDEGAIPLRGGLDDWGWGHSAGGGRALW